MAKERAEDHKDWPARKSKGLNKWGEPSKVEETSNVKVTCLVSNCIVVWHVNGCASLDVTVLTAALYTLNSRTFLRKMRDMNPSWNIQFFLSGNKESDDFSYLWHQVLQVTQPQIRGRKDSVLFTLCCYGINEDCRFIFSTWGLFL